MSLPDTAAYTIEAIDSEVERLTAEVGRLRLALTEVQERLSILESRTSDTFELVSPTAAQTSTASAAGYRVGAEREAVARKVGAWLRRALSGAPRGLSGREENPARSRYYLVIRDFNNRVHSPPLFFEAWAHCNEVVCSHGQPGDSIFVGLPTKEECRIALEAGGFSLPSSLSSNGGSRRA